jgi:hypothetical protein
VVRACLWLAYDPEAESSEITNFKHRYTEVLVTVKAVVEATPIFAEIDGHFTVVRVGEGS